MERSNLIGAIQTKGTTTANGMPTHITSGSYCLDLFGLAGAARGLGDDVIVNAFVKAFEEDSLVAMKILFWARDVRGGAGERRFFRVIMKYLSENRPEALNKVLHLVPEYGRWDDLFLLEDDCRIMDIIKEGLAQKNGLLAKWLPRKGKFAEKVRKHLGLKPAEYRRLIVGLSKTVEQSMCAKEWDGIVYPHVPSQAMNKYRKAFFRNDEARFSQFIADVGAGKTKINSSTVFPYQLYNAFKKGERKSVVEAQWNALPDFLAGSTQRILPICDVSGSMTCIDSGVKHGVTPMSVCISLGIYISERNKGLFKDAFVTFSKKPTLQILKGSFYERCRQLEEAHWEMNTDIEAVFNLLLDSAAKASVTPEEMPTMLLIISDMQFDSCVQEPDNTALEMIRNKYKAAGYQMPSLIFWNVNANADQSVVRYNDKGAGIVSGFTPAILKSVIKGTVANPLIVMLETVMTDRYAPIEL